ncbi:MAG: hypothetical protein A2W90_09445 [Bacteroidetes bacterium GWF2_42_66]|nr:MAG: hypothetical protein A2W92_00135 [Bacteroidetes bacterium GWA2_42_15]OFY01966.1 MAG: hypothetical protein A2W89_22650 [Bacteroidetes bacterium GWE2_42_39]OFY46496.1 MAG: hypothetical protein A2W90_09445 [Bacteroidetes bacterium GWF2_42_66]
MGKLLYIIALGISIFSFKPEKSLNVVNVTEFSAIPDDGQNDATQLREAVNYCKSSPGTKLYFPPGIYNFKDEKAVKLMNGILNGSIKGNPSDSIFRPYYPYVKGLNFDGTRNVIVEAHGATLLCEGWMEPVSLTNCKNVKIEGLTIDYKRKPYSVGEIIEVQKEWFDVKFSDLYSVTANMPLCRLHIWDVKSHRMILQDLNYFPHHEMIAPQTLRIYCKLNQDVKGNIVTIAHTLHFRPAILLFESKDIEIEDVTIHSQPGMGILGHRSENIHLNGVRIVPVAGQLMSTNTDASHFTSCKGFIRYENCLFEGQGDDAINIHNYYLTIIKPTGKGYNLVSKAKLHAQILDYPDVGDTLELVTTSGLEVVKKVVVRSRENNIEGLYSHITLNEELPSDLENFYLINITRLPRVEITGCSVTSNRARGFLIKTRNVLIEHNLIRESTGTGIQIGAEGNWYEGPTSENVIIRYNSIIRCGTGAGTIAGSCGIAINVDAPNKFLYGLHKHITIEGNIIEGENAKNGIYVSNVEDLNICCNEITGCINPIKIDIR